MRLSVLEDCRAIDEYNAEYCGVIKEHVIKKSLTVLSLFDGMSCGQLALDKLGIEVENYYAAEIDKYAIAVAKHNYPNTQHLGDVTNWKNWDIDWVKIDLLIGGSPCQGFSFAGKQLAFDDPRSKLFFVYVDILNHIKSLNPNVKFMLENVRMKKEYLSVISEYLGVKPVMVNSALVSAQNRVRFYWTNIAKIEQPKDKGILLKDILETGSVDREKSYCLDANYSKGASYEQYKNKSRRQLKCVQSESKDSLVVQVGDKLRHREATKKGYAEAGVGEGLDLTFPNSKTRRGRGMQKKSNCLTAASHEMGAVFRCVEVGKANIKGRDQIKRVYSPEGKSPTLTTMQGGHQEPKVLSGPLAWRKLTPKECERLQTVPDNYTLVPLPPTKNGKIKMMSNSQRYKMLGNGWTIEVIKHIFKNLTYN